MRGLVGIALLVAGFSYWIYFYTQILRLRKQVGGAGLGLTKGIPWFGVMLMGLGIAVFFQPYFLSHPWVSVLFSAPVISAAILLGSPRGFYVFPELKMMSDKLRAEVQNQRASEKRVTTSYDEGESSASITTYLFLALLLFFLILIDELPYLDESFKMIDAANQSAQFSVFVGGGVYLIDVVAHFFGFRGE